MAVSLGHLPPLETEKVNILLVDDQPAKLLGYQAILGKLGHTLLLASNGREALEHLLKHDVAVILMDVFMPEQDGFELLELIRQHHRFQSTAVIFISAVNLSDIELLRGYANGAVDFVSVPIVPEVLRAKVEVFVDLHRKTRALERLNQSLEQRVTERTDELRGSEARFQLMAETIPSLIWTSDAAGTLNYANGRFQDYVGLTEVTEGKWLLDAIHPEERQRCKRAWQRALATGSPFEIEHRTQGKDGSYRWFLTRALPQVDDRGRPLAWFGVSMDIEEQKRAEARIKESEQMYKAIGDSLDYGIWVADTDGRNLYTSQSFLEMLGITQEECAEGAWTNFIVDKDDGVGLRKCQDAMASGLPFSREIWFRGADGCEHPVLSRGVPVTDHSGKITAWVGINLDIAQMKAAELRLLEADRRKDEFLATLAHELRNPLAPIRSGLDLMRLKGDAPETLRDLRGMLERQVNQMVRMVDDLLDVSRITRGTLTLQFAEVDLAEIVRSSVETSMPGIAAKSHSLDIQLPPSTVSIWADATRLAQVLSNLLNNAARYTPPSGSISIRAWAEGREAIVCVQDTGVGFTPQQSSAIFEMFTQVDNGSRSSGGLGIGLTLAKRLIEMHGGSIEARSDGLDAGSEFTVRIPIVPALSSSVKTQEDSLHRNALRIVIADDNEDALHLLQLMLSAMGHQVATGKCGADAIRLVEETKPHVAILDIGMPNVNGFEAARAIRQLESGDDVFLVALTGWGQPEDRRMTMEAGFNRHLTKPADVKQLSQILDYAASEWKSTKSEAMS